MKHLIIVIAFIVTIHTANAGWFRDDTELRHRQQVEQKLEKQQQITGNWQQASFALGIGCIVALIVGAAIGSKGRKSAKPIQ